MTKKHNGKATYTLEDFQKAAEMLTYNPETGEVFWAVKPSIGVNAGDPAGYISNGYLKVTVQGKALMVHRLAWFMHYGTMPPLKVDHIDRDTLNNRIENLRDGTGGVNEWNRRPNKTKKTGLPKGVSRASTKARPYLAQITAQGKKRFLGHFATVEEAEAAYQKAVQLLHTTQLQEA